MVRRHAQFVNYYKDYQKDELLLSDFVPNIQFNISILLESDIFSHQKFLSIGDLYIKKIRTQYDVSLDFNDSSFSMFEESDEYSKIIKNNDFKKSYNILKNNIHGLYRDALLSSGSINVDGSYMTNRILQKINSFDFLKQIESLCNFYLDTNALLYHFIFLLEKNGVKINQIKWNIVPAVIWELESLGRRSNNIYDVRKAKSAFRDISHLLSLGVLIVDNNSYEYKEPNDRVIREQIKNSINNQPIINGILKQNYFITFDNIMALASFAEGINTIQFNMPLEHQHWEIKNITHFLSQLSEIFGTIKITQESHTFYLQGDWPGKSSNHWCNGDIIYFT